MENLCVWIQITWRLNFSFVTNYMTFSSSYVSGEWIILGAGQWALINSVVSEDLHDWVTFQQRPEWSEFMRHADNWSKYVLDRRKVCIKAWKQECIWCGKVKQKSWRDCSTVSERRRARGWWGHSSISDPATFPMTTVMTLLVSLRWEEAIEGIRTDRCHDVT